MLHVSPSQGEEEHRERAAGPAPWPRALCLTPSVSPGVLQVIVAARGGDKSPAFRVFDPRKSPVSQEMSRLRHMHNLLKP